MSFFIKSSSSMCFDPQKGPVGKIEGFNIKSGREEIVFGDKYDHYNFAPPPTYIELDLQAPCESAQYDYSFRLSDELSALLLERCRKYRFRLGKFSFYAGPMIYKDALRGYMTKWVRLVPNPNKGYNKIEYVTKNQEGWFE